tara:strand:- start:367 stop:570 length:204 start_codon:yes stop_codon:yes gene_type:complete
MRCRICDSLLNDFEVTRKYPKGHDKEGEYVDICSNCLRHIKDVTYFEPDYNVSSLEYDVNEGIDADE